MKATCTVIFLVLCTSWIYSAQASAIPAEVERANDAELLTTEAATTDAVDLESNVAANITEEDVEQALAQESEAANAIEPEVRPTKRPKRPHNNKRPAGGDHKPHHHNPMTFSESWPFYPVPAQIPYPCPYPQPMFYPMPMFSPYFFPTQVHNPEKKSPAMTLKSDGTDSAESGEEITNEELLRNANFWNNRFANKWANKNSTTTTVKPTKRFLIRNWVANKMNKKTTTTTTTTTLAPLP